MASLLPAQVNGRIQLSYHFNDIIQSSHGGLTKECHRSHREESQNYRGGNAVKCYTGCRWVFTYPIMMVIHFLNRLFRIWHISSDPYSLCLPRHHTSDVRLAWFSYRRHSKRKVSASFNYSPFNSHHSYSHYHPVSILIHPSSLTRRLVLPPFINTISHLFPLIPFVISLVSSASD